MTLKNNLNLNLACGDSKIKDCINIDLNLTLKPDLCANAKFLPFKNESIDNIIFSHAIEHIPEIQHEELLFEFRRVLKASGELLISYPEFKKVAQNYIDNAQGRRDFWKATIYGLQRYAGDYHVALMDSDYFKDFLREVGFDVVKLYSEPHQPFNTVILCTKVAPLPTYVDVLRKEVFE